MFQRGILVANAIINVVVGIGLIFAANAILGIYGGMSMEPATDQLLGSALVGIAIVNFLSRDVRAPDARRAVLWGNFVYNLLAVLVMVIAAMGGAPTAVWVTVGVAVLFTIGFGYLAFGARVMGRSTEPATA